MRVIAVTGTPGTGKTALSKKLSKRLNFLYIDVNKLILMHNLSEGYDRKRKTRIIDANKLNKFLILHIKNLKKDKKLKGVIIDSHLSHCIPKKNADLCIVTKCSIKELNKRLKRKRFHKQKIQENLQAEIFDVCHNEAVENKHNILIVDTSKGFNINDAVKKLN